MEVVFSPDGGSSAPSTATLHCAEPQRWCGIGLRNRMKIEK